MLKKQCLTGAQNETLECKGDHFISRLSRKERESC